MKLAVCSDLHLEFGDLDLTNDENADVLILGGDIFIAEDLDHLEPLSNVLVPTKMNLRAHRYYEFIKRCCERFPNVILVMGNHEHYHGDFALTTMLINRVFGEFENLHFLDKESLTLGGIIFYGGTLWTNFNNGDPTVMSTIRGIMNDYRGVKNTGPDAGGKFLPEDSLRDHNAFMQGLNEQLALYPTETFVVVGHHAPSKASTHPRYKNEGEINHAYSSNLDEFILNNRNIKMWTHGHTHEGFDYMIGGCRVVCNPRGYIDYEDCADDFKLKYWEI
jgi:Icc-related predicted phosphoesterase